METMVIFFSFFFSAFLNPAIKIQDSLYYFKALTLYYGVY